ncbi:hypothetical protein, partial [Yersinia mollaretii]|uniref:hypothetical protein n=1 Tax=Yersinia mollaretii TaxID=33060 RepID=UPI001C98257E
FLFLFFVLLFFGLWCWFGTVWVLLLRLWGWFLCWVVGVLVFGVFVGGGFFWRFVIGELGCWFALGFHWRFIVMLCGDSDQNQAALAALH